MAKKILEQEIIAKKVLPLLNEERLGDFEAPIHFNVQR